MALWSEPLDRWFQSVSGLVFSARFAANSLTFPAIEAQHAGVTEKELTQFLEAWARRRPAPWLSAPMILRAELTGLEWGGLQYAYGGRLFTTPPTTSLMS